MDEDYFDGLDDSYYDAGVMDPFIVNEAPEPTDEPIDTNDPLRDYADEQWSFFEWDADGNWVESPAPTTTTPAPTTTANPVSNFLKALADLFKPKTTSTTTTTKPAGSGSSGGSSGPSATSNNTKPPTTTTQNPTTTATTSTQAANNAVTLVPIAAALIYLLK